MSAGRAIGAGIVSRRGWRIEALVVPDLATVPPAVPSVRAVVALHHINTGLVLKLGNPDDIVPLGRRVVFVFVDDAVDAPHAHRFIGALEERADAALPFGISTDAVKCASELIAIDVRPVFRTAVAANRTVLGTIGISGAGEYVRERGIADRIPRYRTGTIGVCRSLCVSSRRHPHQNDDDKSDVPTHEKISELLCPKAQLT